MPRKPKDLLQKEVLKLDNHHPNIPLNWDDEKDKTIHMHKSMLVKDNHGRRVRVSARLNLNSKREVQITFDDAKHTKIKDKSEVERYIKQIKGEINECLADSKEAASFVEHIYKALSSLSYKNEALTQKRMNEAFDNVMDSLGVSTKQKAIIKNNNGKILSFYLTGNFPTSYNHTEYIWLVHFFYRRHYHMDIIDGFPLYYIVYDKKKLVMGEYNPQDALTYAMKGYKYWLENIEELSDNAIEGDRDN